MRCLLLLMTILLTASPAFAGPAAKRMMAVTGSSGPVAFTVNGWSGATTDFLESGGAWAYNDTGTESISAGAGDITIVAHCIDNGSSVGVVSLIVGGVTRATLTCDANNDKTETLSYTVAAGSHDVRVTVSADPGAYALATTFRKKRL